MKGTWPNYQDVKNEKLIVAIDFGVKKNILRLLRKHVGKVEVVNAQISFRGTHEASTRWGIFIQWAWRS
jgi:carbamoylphosphate synthase small subunit